MSQTLPKLIYMLISFTIILYIILIIPALYNAIMDKDITIILVVVYIITSFIALYYYIMKSVIELDKMDRKEEKEKKEGLKNE